MSTVAVLIADLVRAGVEPSLIGRVAQAIADSANAADAGRDEPAKTKAALRTERWRARKASPNVTVTSHGDGVTENVTVTSQTVTDRHAVTPLARGLDKPLTVVVTGDSTTPHSARDSEDLDWPPDAKPSRAYLDRLEAACREAGGAALDPTATKLFSLAPILALGRDGKGPPCDLQADVLPTIRARSLKAARHSIGGWEYFTRGCLESRDRRLAGADAVRELRPAVHDPTYRPTFADQIADERRRATELTLASLKASNG